MQVCIKYGIKYFKYLNDWQYVNLLQVNKVKRPFQVDREDNYDKPRSGRKQIIETLKNCMKNHRNKGCWRIMNNH